MKAHRMDQATVEQLLDGPVGDPRGGLYPLVLLLSAVRATPDASELAGEAAAVHAYRMARAGTPLDVPSQPRREFTLAGFGVRAVLASLLVAATGGVALAAASGTLPNPLHGPTPGPSSPVPTSVASPGPAGGPGSMPPTGADGQPDPSAAVVGLCHAYRAGAGENPGQALDNPVFADLVGAAGGRDKVAGYCDQILAEAPGRATPHGTPTDRPGGQPTVQPTDRQTEAPTGRPESPRSGGLESGADRPVLPPSGGTGD